MSETNHEQLISNAYTDSLTGLPNRRWLDETLERRLSETPDTTAVLFIDLDRLKAANDTNGYRAGDAMIAHAAEAIQASIRGHREDDARKSDEIARGRRAGNHVSRAGGDEFVIILSEVTSDEGIEKAAQRIREQLDGEAVEASVGFARAQAGMSVAELLDKAAKSMQEDKTKRKIEHLTDRQKRAYREIGFLAARYEVDLRDAPIVLSGLDAAREFTPEEA